MDRKARKKAVLSLRDAFFSGVYDDVLRRTVDSASFEFADDDAAFVVGALAFAGRVEEGRAVLAGWDTSSTRRSLSAESRCAARFFLGVAYCRSGRFADATAMFSETMKIARADRGPGALFYMHQGFGCLRYFTGRIAHSGRHALRALRCAYTARFQYGRFLATDLRGHALVETGSVRAGLALLKQAKEIAEAMGLAGNAGALECTMTVFAASFGTKPIAESIEDLERLVVAAPARDSYSIRAVRMELACQLALCGRSDSAWGLLEQLSSHPIPDGDLRARVRILLSLAFAARLRFGAASASPYLSEARRLVVGTHDVTLEAEVITSELLNDGADAARLERLRELARLGRMARAVAALERYSKSVGAILPPDELCEDRAGALVLYASGRPPGGAELLERAGYLGLVPSALGLEPGRRVLILSPRCVLLEERGNVRALEDVTESTLRLLRALASGPRHEKAELFRKVWNLNAYSPERHDPVIHTAVSRLRTALGTARHWVEVRDGAYAFDEGVEFFELRDDSHLLEGDRSPATTTSYIDFDEASASNREVAASTSLLRMLAESPKSTTDIASSLGVSEMTVLRRLRNLVDAGTVIRDGRGRNTRYLLKKPSEDVS